MKKHINRKRIVITCVLLVLVALIFGYFTMDDIPATDIVPDVSVSTEAEPKEPINSTPAIIGGVAAIVVYYLFTLLAGAIKKRWKKDR